MRAAYHRTKFLAGACLLTVAMVLASCNSSKPGPAAAAPTMRRLTEAQYRNIISDIFGDEIMVSGRFDSPERVDGLLEIGTASAGITPSAFERYDQLARAIAAQVVSPSNRKTLIPCQPVDAKAPDRSCAGTYYARIGRYLYRRPLTEKELSSRLDVAEAATRRVGDFYAGLAAGLATLLETPEFLYVTDEVEPDPARPGNERLTGYSRAARLSFFLWNSGPDDALLTAAEHGDLATAAGLRKQVARMADSPRFEAGLRAFFADMLGFDQFESLEKDAVIYPAFSEAVAHDAKEQTLRTIVDFLVDERGDYRDLFTLRKTVLTRPIGMLYHAPVDDPAGWMDYEFPPNDPHGGLLTQISFLALYSHPGKSSPTLRGRAIRELLLCQKIPDPPANVNFDAFNDPNSPHKTARERLTAHATDPSCAGCHRLMDPIGLAMETFDGAGQMRTTENGERIDTAGQMDGRSFTDAVSLGRLLHDSPAATSCLVNRAYEYAIHRAPARDERPWMDYLGQQFSRGGYKVPDLFAAIASDPALYAVMSPTRQNVASRNEGNPQEYNP